MFELTHGGQEWPSLIAELERRKAVVSVVDGIIDEFLKPMPRNKIKRGVIHSIVGSRLGVIINNDLCRLVNERMRLKGYRALISSGKLYFRNVAFK